MASRLSDPHVGPRLVVMIPMHAPLSRPAIPLCNGDRVVVAFDNNTAEIIDGSLAELWCLALLAGQDGGVVRWVVSGRCGEIARAQVFDDYEAARDMFRSLQADAGRLSTIPACCAN